jgi:hypothetical protein
MRRFAVAKPARKPRPKLALAGTILLGLLTSACDKCGDWAWDHPAKTCHDESQLK